MEGWMHTTSYRVANTQQNRNKCDVPSCFWILSRDGSASRGGIYGIYFLALFVVAGKSDSGLNRGFPWSWLLKFAITLNRNPSVRPYFIVFLFGVGEITFLLFYGVYRLFDITPELREPSDWTPSWRNPLKAELQKGVQQPKWRTVLKQTKVSTLFWRLNK